MEQYSVEAYLKATGVDQFSKAFRDADNSLNGVEDSSKKANVSIGSMLKTIAGVAAAVGVFRVLRSAVGRAFDRIDTMEQFERVMTTMTGSTEKANKVLDETNDIVTGTSYGLDTAARAVQGFVTSNMDVDQATKSVAAWGDAVSFYGDGADETFNSVTIALSQMSAKGKVQMDTMNRLTEAGIPAMQIFADATGRSVEDVAAEMQKGELAADEFITVMNDALKNGTDNFGAIDGAAKDAGASWQGSFANMQAATARGVISIIDSIDELLTSNGLPDMRGMIANFGSFMEDTLKSASKAVEPLGNALFKLIDAVKPLMPAILGLVSAFIAFQAVIAISSIVSRLSTVMFILLNPVFALQYAFATLNAIILANPFAWLAALIAGVTVAIVYLWNTNDGFRDAVTSAWSTIKDTIASSVPVIKGAIDSIAEFFSNLSTGAINAFNTSIEWLASTVQKVSDFFVNLKESVDIKGVFTTAIAPLTTVATLFLGLASPIGWLIKGFALLSTQTTIFSDALKVLSGDMSIGQFAQNFATEIANLITSLAESATEMISKGAEMVTNFLKGVEQNLPAILETGTQAVNNFAEGLSSSIGEIAPIAVQMITSFVESITSAIPQILEVGVQILTTIINAIVTNLPMMIETYMQIVQTLINTVVMMIPLIIETITMLITTIIETFIAMLPMMIETYMMLFQTLIDTVVMLLPQIIEVILMLVMMIVTTIVESLPMLIDAGIQILTALINGIITVLPVLIESIIMIIQSLLTVIIENLPLIIDAGIQILMALIDGIISILPVLIESGIDLLMQLVATFISLLPQLINAGIQILLALINGIISVLPQLISAGIKLIVQLVAAIIGMLPDLLSAGVDLIMALIEGALSLIGDLLSAGKDLVFSMLDGITGMFGDLLSAGKDLAGNALDGVKGKIGDFLDAGKNIVGSIADGISSAKSAVTNAISNVTQGIRDFLPFSPAKEGALRDIMKIQIPQSIAQSIDNGKRSAIQAMSSLSDAIYGEMPQMDIAGQVAGSSAKINTSIDHQVNQNDSSMMDLFRQALNKENIIVLEDGTLVGKTAPKYNRVFGNEAQNSERWGDR